MGSQDQWLANSARLGGIGSHHSARATSDEWWTPPDLLAQLTRKGQEPFDLDPCAPVENPGWSGCREAWTAEHDGLLDEHPWDGHGEVYCNPPYSEVGAWMAKLAAHDDGIALVFARTEVAWWFESVWGRASSLLFLRGRLSFWAGGRKPARQGHNAGGPSVLIAYGPRSAARLADGRVPGAHVPQATLWR